MERLTGISKITGMAMPKKMMESCGEDGCRDVCNEYCDNGCKECPVQECMTMLSTYEDTGLTQEEIRDTVKLLEEVTAKYETSVKMHSITTKKLNEYKDAEEQGLLIKANNGNCDNCKCLADLGDCVIFGYGKDTIEMCKQACSSLKGSVSE